MLGVFFFFLGHSVCMNYKVHIISRIHEISKPNNFWLGVLVWGLGFKRVDRFESIFISILFIVSSLFFSILFIEQIEAYVVLNLRL